MSIDLPLLIKVVKDMNHFVGVQKKVGGLHWYLGRIDKQPTTTRKGSKACLEVASITVSVVTLVVDSDGIIRTFNEFLAWFKQTYTEYRD